MQKSGKKLNQESSSTQCSDVLTSQFSRSATTEVFGPKGIKVQAAVSFSTSLGVRKLARSGVDPNFQTEIMFLDSKSVQ